MTQGTFKALEHIEEEIKELQERYEADVDCLDNLDRCAVNYEDEAIQILYRMQETKKRRMALMYAVGVVKAVDGGDRMTREDEIKALMSDGCTRQEAKRHLKSGTIVYESLSDYIDCLADNCLFDPMMEQYDASTVDEFETRIKDGSVDRVSAVDVDGHTYIVEYSL